MVSMVSMVCWKASRWGIWNFVTLKGEFDCWWLGVGALRKRVWMEAWL